jgi:hypothetical protein
MIQFTATADGRRLAIVCESCARSIESAADAVVVPWAARSALVVHDGACLDLLRLQYPSTLRAAVVPLTDAIDQLAAIRDAGGTAHE